MTLFAAGTDIFCYYEGAVALSKTYTRYSMEGCFKLAYLVSSFLMRQPHFINSAYFIMQNISFISPAFDSYISNSLHELRNSFADDCR